MFLIVCLIVFGALAIASRWRKWDRADRDWLCGGARIGAGLAKIVLLGWPLARIAALSLEAAPLAQSPGTTWIGALAWALMLYFSVSGIADFAHGVDHWLGRKSPEMVVAPLRADGFTSAWLRWNSTAAVLCPRAGRFIQAALNVVVMAVVSALAFGVAWPIAGWTGLHLFLVALERWRGRSLFFPLPLAVRVGLTASVVIISMLVLRLPDTSSVAQHARALFVASRPTLYSVMLEARMTTGYLTAVLVTAGMIALAGPRLAWVLALPARKWRWACAVLGCVALAMVTAHLVPPPADSARAFVRHLVQWPLTRLFNEGNRCVHVGSSGWLFPQHELDRLTQLDSRSELTDALLAIHSCLRGKGIPLLVIPVPPKAALLPEYILAAEYRGPAHAIGYRASVERLRGAGIDVLDPADHLWSKKRSLTSHFKTETSWTPEAMKEVAALTAKHIRAHWPRLTSDETPPIDVTILDRAGAGDLARRLDPWAPASLFGEEMMQLVSIRGLASTADAPILLVGGASIQVYDDPALTPGNAGGGRLHAGFATQLATLIGRPMDVRAGTDGSLAGILRQFESDSLAVLAGKRLVVVVVPATAM